MDANTEAPKSKVLIVEDEDDARFIYLDILTNAGFAVVGAENGQAALDAMAKEKFQLVLLDIIMPDMDGISVLSKLKADATKYGTPKVVMLTNIGGDLAIEKALQIGAIGYMLKSETDPETLISFVNRYLAGEINIRVDSMAGDQN